MCCKNMGKSCNSLPVWIIASDGNVSVTECKFFVYTLKFAS